MKENGGEASTAQVIGLIPRYVAAIGNRCEGFMIGLEVCIVVNLSGERVFHHR